MTDYEQGFMDKCAELGVDPVKLAGFGDYLMGGGPFGVLGRGAYNLGRGIRHGAQYLASIPGQIGERIGNNYARWAAENPAPLTQAQQNDRLRAQIGYANRTLRGYRAASGVPHQNIAVPQHLIPKQPGAAAQTPAANALGMGGLIGRIAGQAR